MSKCSFVYDARNEALTDLLERAFYVLRRATASYSASIFVAVGFLFPVFLVAGISLAIPLLIHLFNLRRYKTVFFPHTRFLKSIQLRSRRSSEVRYKWLLALRMLFLAALVAAFAQPLFKQAKNGSGDRKLQVIYIDNNPAMTLKKGAVSGLDAALSAARNQLGNASADSRFLLLTNDKPFSYEPQSPDKVAGELGAISVSPSVKSAGQVFATVQSLLQTQNTSEADLYFYSDFAHTTFDAHPATGDVKGIALHAIAVQPTRKQNIFIDTAYLTTPVLQAGQSNSLIVRSKKIPVGDATVNEQKTSPVIQLSINSQVRNASSLHFDASGTSTDTLSFSVSDAGWQKITLSVADASIPFDDTFRLAARSAPGLSILVLNEGSQSPYIQAAFRSYNGFTVRNDQIGNAPTDWKPYNLIILNGITGLPDALTKKISAALSDGLSVCIFPGRSQSTERLNSALSSLGDVHIAAYDSAQQPVTNMQQGAPLVKDIFEGIPPNVQLPLVTWHYAIQSGLSASGQSILTFRNGDPLLAKYNLQRGALYLCATSADLEGGNFPASYFFVPFLYQMAAQSKGGDVYALTSGLQQSAYLPIPNSNERNMVHLYGTALDVIPPQRTAGGGMDVFVDAVVQQPGFYKLAANLGDSAIIALNGTRSYSSLDLWNIDALRKEWTGAGASWQTPETASSKASHNGASFPLWKVCAILALLLTFAETYVLFMRTDSSGVNTATS